MAPPSRSPRGDPGATVVRGLAPLDRLDDVASPLVYNYCGVLLEAMNAGLILCIQPAAASLLRGANAEVACGEATARLAVARGRVKHKGVVFPVTAAMWSTCRTALAALHRSCILAGVRVLDAGIQEYFVTLPDGAEARRELDGVVEFDGRKWLWDYQLTSTSKRSDSYAAKLQKTRRRCDEGVPPEWLAIYAGVVITQVLVDGYACRAYHRPKTWAELGPVLLAGPMPLVLA